MTDHVQDLADRLEQWRDKAFKLQAERDRVIAHCRAHNHSGTSPGYQLACLRVLELMGEAINEDQLTRRS